jgi:hypothetical protein
MSSRRIAPRMDGLFAAGAGEHSRQGGSDDSNDSIRVVVAIHPKHQSPQTVNVDYKDKDKYKYESSAVIDASDPRLGLRESQRQTCSRYPTGHGDGLSG